MRKPLLLLAFVCASLSADIAQAAITRGPYLQDLTPTSVVVRWRTTAAANSRVRFGLSTIALTMTTDDLVSTLEHSVRVTGLAPGTRYYYTVGSTTVAETTPDAGTYFATAPPAGTARHTRIWAIGDSGLAGADSRAVRDGYLSYAGSLPADLWLLLGDNAYSSGTDAEYQSALFNIYPTILRKTPVWSTFGNHEGISSISATQTGPYYNLFTLPAQGEAGGVPSGTEAWYSFDYANIHFVCLNSYDVDRTAAGPMVAWLRQDLQANTQEWLVAYWHHPPYSKGSHDSDAEVELIQMRTYAMPILEEFGVDLVLSGHSHSYERSMLLDSHYGIADSLNISMKRDPGDGKVAGDGAYVKPQMAPHAGTVAVVTGTSSRIAGGQLNHAAMRVSLSVLGSTVLDVDGPRLDAAFIGTNGAVIDSFTIFKGPGAPCAAAPAEVAALGFDPVAPSLSWRRPIGAYGSHVYQGTVAPGGRVDWSLGCRATAIAAERIDLPEIPPPASFFYYLVGGVNDCGLSSPGTGSGGAPRPAFPSCP